MRAHGWESESKDQYQLEPLRGQVSVPADEESPSPFAVYSAYQRREKRVAPKIGLSQQQRVWLERFAKGAFQGLGEGGHNEWAIVCEGQQARQALRPFLISVNNQAGRIGGRKILCKVHGHEQDSLGSHYRTTAGV